jgi:hypothetical protein
MAGDVLPRVVSADVLQFPVHKAPKPVNCDQFVSSNKSVLSDHERRAQKNK